MARIRSIKPEFWTSAQVLECSTNARLLFLGTWNFADDAGRHPWSAKQVKAEIFPADDFTEKQVLGWMEELVSNGLIERYQYDGKEYFYITGWKHQRIDKPQAPKYPDPFGEYSKIIPGTFPPDTIRYDTIGNEEDSSLRSLGHAIDVRRETPDWPEDYRDQFWNAYPRKKAKQAAFKALDRIRREGRVPFDQILVGIQKIPKGEPQFIPHPATWLNQGRWDDEILPGETDGHRGSRTLQDDSRSVSRALERQAAQGVEFAPRPSLFSSEGSRDLRLLPAGRSPGPGDVCGSSGDSPGGLSEADRRLRGGPPDGGGDEISDGTAEYRSD